MILSSDIYQINQFLDELKLKHIPADDANSLVLGIFGYLGDVFSTQIQNSIVLSSEWMNEFLPIRARLEKNLLTHAMMAGITDLTAIPSKMEMLLGIREKDLLANMKNDVFILDRDTTINIGTFEFHLEYDVKIFRQKTNKKDLYVAQYDLIGKNNRLSSTSNPYLLPPVRTKAGNEDFIFIRAIIRQTEFKEFHKKIISTDEVENKTLEFSFENQLADFILTITNNKGASFDFIPLYEDSPIMEDGNNYCYYSYINSNTVKVRFINSIYIPKINDDITIKIITTKGEKGNFTYKDDILIEPTSTVYQYTNLLILGKPVTEAGLGENKKTIEQLKKIIPRELLSRESITCVKDLYNFFNVLNDRFNRLEFLEKVHNQFERSYYSFLLLKDINNVIPTNTINVNLNEEDFSTIGDRLVLKPGTPLQYDKYLKRNVVINKNTLTSNRIKLKETEGFLYSSPFTVVVNKDPLVVSHYLTIFDRRYNTLFKYINESSYLQFISTKISWKRDLVVDTNYYKLDIELTQNIDEEFNLVEVDENGFITSSKIKVLAVLYDKNNNPYRYLKSDAIYYDKGAKTYKYRFKIETDDDITRESDIRILNGYDIGTDSIMNGYIGANGCKMAIYILADLGMEYGSKESIDTIIPGLEGYTLCNMYEVEDGVDFFINFSEIISSKIKVEYIGDTEDYYYKLDGMPVCRYSYLTISEQVKYLINYILDKKAFLDLAISRLENSFNIDFKFFNTYGPSNTYAIGHTGENIDRINIGLTLRIKFTTMTNNASFVEMVKTEIKKYIENINNITDLHISQLYLHLKKTFNFISYIEFLNINNYDTQHQSITKTLKNKEVYVPEFINIGSTDIKYNPDINIIVL